MSRSPLDQARAGDEQAFRELVVPHVGELRLHCYRILGSVADAEDLLQETLLAAWRGLDTFAGRSSLRAWLYRIATNRCLNAIRDAKRRAPREPAPPFPPPEPSRRGEVTWLQPYPDTWLEQTADTEPGPATRYQARETVELAFITALQRLPSRQTAALLLCDVLGFAPADVAVMLDTSPTAVKGILQRARAAVDSGTAGHDAAPAAGSPAEQDLARRFARAFTEDDIDGVVALLTDDGWLAMPPAPHEYHGPAAVAAFLRASASSRGQRHFRLVPCRANTQPAFACYLPTRDQPTRDQPTRDQPSAEAVGLVVLTLSGHRIRGVTRFLDDGLPGVFGLDRVLEPGTLLDPGRDGCAELHGAPHGAEPVMGHPDRVGQQRPGLVALLPGRERDAERHQQVGEVVARRVPDLVPADQDLERVRFGPALLATLPHANPTPAPGRVAE